MSSFEHFQQTFGELLANPSAALDPGLRRALAVHRNTSMKAAQDALGANYPVLGELVGAAAFQGCAYAFVESRPPADPRLCLYGETFASHVADWPAFSEYSYLSAVARLERLVVEALFAANAAILDASLFAAAVDPQMPLALHPATRLAFFDCPAASLWHAHQADHEEDLASIAWVPEIALVTRPHLTVEVRAVDEATHAFLTASTIGEAAAAAHDKGGDVAAIFSSLLLSGAFACSIS